MISYIKGTIASQDINTCVLDVGGIGYLLGVSGSTAGKLPAVGEQIQLWTYLQVREDAMTLYGFITKEERTSFERLNSVTGIGPKVALAILSRFSSEELARVVLAEDVRLLSTAPGVGKKTAQRIILELKSIFEQEVKQLSDLTPLGTSEENQGISNAKQEAVEALLAMGFTSEEVDVALKGYDGDIQDSAKAISYALRRLGSTT